MWEVYIKEWQYTLPLTIFSFVYFWNNAIVLSYGF